ncbi:carotenoid biosynthesis protein [Nocardia transvalensis]|uniref:carotenoid biosynthesis protein n=1 Tax=Nocardia transvalensis TaxID=37333 RepID=UPI001893DCF5|nr:carotenoid biosynthesis protein [Nocardia transvalensis]MBF6330175.1 carotenoid biosynthesis protein [Nocardia transvalensis]
MKSRWLPVLPAVAWVLAQIAYPLTGGAARDRVTVVVVLLSAATALAHAWVSRGPRFAAGFLLIVSGLGLTAEIIGTAYGFPFGCYHYAHGRLGPELATVPLLVPLAWTGGMYPVWVVARRVYHHASLRIPMTALGAVGWDLFLDPQMVADGQWTWCSAAPGLPGLPQIPYTNYLGWFAVAVIMAALLELLTRGAAPRDPSLAVPIAVFLWTWLGSTLAHAVFLHLPSSAVYGGIGMGILAMALAVRSRHGGPCGGARRRMPLRSACHGTM